MRVSAASPSWAGTALFGVAAVALAVAAFFAVQLILPGGGHDIAAVEQPAPAKQVAVPVKVTKTPYFTSTEWITPAESKSCDAAGSKARTAAMARLAKARQPTGSSFEIAAAVGYGDAAKFACLAQTRPSRFCDDGQRKDLIFLAYSELHAIDDTMKIVGRSDAELIAMQKSDQALSRIAPSSLRLDLADWQAAATSMLQQMHDALGTLTGAGYIPLQIIRDEPHYPSPNSGRLLDGLPEGAGICAG